MQGKLIIIEAGDGAGKATQTNLLYERLKNEGKKVRKIEFPDYESEGSALVRMYLGGAFGAKADSVNPYAASTFFAADRFASYRMKWKDDYENGCIILSDRYTTSNLAHQAVKIEDEKEKKEFLAWLLDFEYNKMGVPKPDAVIFLNMDRAASERLIEARAKNAGIAKDIHEKDSAYLDRSHREYIALAEKYGWIKIKCSEDGEPFEASDIHERVYSEVKALLGENS